MKKSKYNIWQIDRESGKGYRLNIAPMTEQDGKRFKRRVYEYWAKRGDHRERLYTLEMKSV